MTTDEMQTTVEEGNNPATTETKVVDGDVIGGVVVPDPSQVNPGVNSNTSE